MRALLLLLALAQPAAADVVVAARTIPARTLIGPEDLLVRPMAVPGGVADPAEVVGLESRVALYAGRPVRPQDVGLPAVVERNAIVALIYEAGRIHISTEGRALERAGPGEVIRIMNLSSRTTVSARIGIDGAAYVSQ